MHRRSQFSVKLTEKFLIHAEALFKVTESYSYMHRKSDFTVNLTVNLYINLTVKLRQFITVWQSLYSLDALNILLYVVYFRQMFLSIKSFFYHRMKRSFTLSLYLYI